MVERDEYGHPHLARVRVDAEMLAALFTLDSRPVRFRGIPTGARYVRSYLDEETDSVVFVYEHHSFPPIKQGEIIPLKVVEVELIFEENK